MPDPSIASLPILCSFCNQDNDQAHKCAGHIFNLVNRLGKAGKNHKENAFSEIENLVFQGGGVKGIAYVGALRALFEEKRDLKDKVKRVAGSSAGALAALYLSLGHDINQIAEYLEKNLLEKLDDEPVITTNGHEHSLKNVFEQLLTTYRNHSQDQVKKMISGIMGPILKDKLGFVGYLTSLFGSNHISGMVSDFICPHTHAVGSTLEESIKVNLENLKHQIEKEERKIDHPTLAQIEDQLPIPLLGLGLGSSKKVEKHADVDNSFHRALSVLIERTFINPLLKSTKEENGKQPDLTEEDLEDLKYANGWFAGQTIKEDLILKPIEDAFARIGQSDLYSEDLTFGEMGQVMDKGKPAFKKLYVTAFNTITKRTEVFSADHTPNVLVADAVRASMSIPVFFKAVRIHEKQDGMYIARKVYYDTKENWRATYYMDGGIKDNYPMWIFDDLQYMIDDSFAPGWVSKQRIPIRNPFTLGLKLVDSEERKVYLKPYVDQECLHKAVSSLPPEQVHTLGLLKTIISIADQENEHINSGDTSRTIYIDNLGVSAVAFDLQVTAMKKYEETGKLGVRQYLNYYRWGKLSDIGQKYAAIQRSALATEHTF